MRPVRSSAAILAAFALVATAAVAHAEQSRDFAAQPNSPTVPHRTLEWDAAKGRWGLRLDMDQHNDRDMQWRDTQLGAYYKLTPRLHIGASAGLGSDAVDTHKVEPQSTTPRVRLETTFKF